MPVEEVAKRCADLTLSEDQRRGGVVSKGGRRGYCGESVRVRTCDEELWCVRVVESGVGIVTNET